MATMKYFDTGTQTWLRVDSAAINDGTDRVTPSDLKSFNRTQMHSGFLNFGGISDFTFSTSTLNAVKINRDLYVNLNGYYVKINANTLIQFNAPPSSGTRNDLAYLKATFNSQGYLTGATIQVSDNASKMSDISYTQDTTDKGLYKNGSNLAIEICTIPRRNTGSYSPSNPNGAKNYYTTGNTNSIATTYTGGSVTFTIASTTGMQVGDFIKSGLNIFYVTAVGSSTQFTATYQTPASSISGVLNFTLVSDRVDGTYANVIDSRDLQIQNDLRHRTQFQYNFDYETKRGSDQFMRGELQNKKVLKTYHGIPKSEIGIETVFYASLDGIITAEVGGPATVTTAGNFVPFPTGSALKTPRLYYATNFTMSKDAGVLDFWSSSEKPGGNQVLIDILNVDSGFRFIRLYVDSNGQLILQGELANNVSIVLGTFFTGGQSKHIRLRWNTSNIITSINGTDKNTASKVAMSGTFNANVYLKWQDSGVALYYTLADISISNIDRGSLFPNLPPDFISGDAQIMPAFTNQRRILSEAQMTQTVNGIAKIANASGTSRGIYTDRMSGNWSAPTAQVETATVVGAITTTGNATVVVTANGMTGSPKTISVAVQAGTAQVETATVAGTITTAGNANVTVTATGMTGSPKTIAVAVALNDTADLVAGKIRTALSADADVSAMFTVSGATTSVVLTAKTNTANDSTLNIAIADGTCVGLTAAPTSANTTSGVAPDDASAVAGKIRTALTADVDVSAKFTISGANADVVLTAKTIAVNDSTLNVNIANGTCAGLTAAPTSANTVYGTLGIITVTGMAGELISGVFDTDTALVTVIKDALSTDNFIYTDSVTGVVDGDEVKLVDRVLGTVLATKTIATSGVDATNKKLTFTTTIGVALGKYQVVVMESTASSSVPAVNFMNGSTKTAITGTWTNLGTNVATFTLGTNASLTNQDIQIDYSIIMPAGQPALIAPTTVTLGGEAGIRVASASLLANDFTGKVSGRTWENPNIAKTGSVIVANNPAPSTFITELLDSEYANILTQNGTSFSYSTSVNGQQAAVLLSFDLIKIVERKLGSKIPAKDVAGKVAWLKANLYSFTFSFWGFGSSPTGNKATPALWTVSNTWSAGTSVTNSIVTKASIANWATLTGIDSNGFHSFLAYAEPSDGVTPSTINVDYTSLDITFADKIVNSFKVISGTLAVRDDFVGKVAGSTVENPSWAYSAVNSGLLTPDNGGWGNADQGFYNAILSLDGTLRSASTSNNTQIGQMMFKFNLIRIVEDKYGLIPAIDKVQWLKDNVSIMSVNWWGYGSCPISQSASGYMASMNLWNVTNSNYDTPVPGYQTTTNNSVTKLNRSVSNISTYVDLSGFVYLISYAPASDGVTASTIYTDYVNIELTFNAASAGYDTLVPENPRRDGGQSNVLFIDKLTKTVSSLFPVSYDLNLCTYSDYYSSLTAISASTDVTIVSELSNWVICDIGSSVGDKFLGHPWASLNYKIGQDVDSLYGELGVSLLPFAEESINLNTGSLVNLSATGFNNNFTKQYGLTAISKPMVGIGRWLCMYNSQLYLLVFSKFITNGVINTDNTGQAFLVNLTGNPLLKFDSGVQRLGIVTPITFKTPNLVVQGLQDKATLKLITTNNSI